MVTATQPLKSHPIAVSVNPSNGEFHVTFFNAQNTHRNRNRCTCHQRTRDDRRHRERRCHPPVRGNGQLLQRPDHQEHRGRRRSCTRRQSHRTHGHFHNRPPPSVTSTSSSTATPATFKYIQGTATVNAWHLIGGQKTESVTPSVDTAARTVNVPSTGWLISPTGSKTVTIEAQYLVAADAPIGSYQEMSSSIGISTFKTEQNISGVYAKIRAKNPGEAAASGSADLGFGSSDGEGGTGSAGSSILDNPAGFISDIISGVLANGS